MAGKFEFDPEKMPGIKAIRDIERAAASVAGHSKIMDAALGRHSVLFQVSKWAETFRPSEYLAGASIKFSPSSTRTLCR